MVEQESWNSEGGPEIMEEWWWKSDGGRVMLEY